MFKIQTSMPCSQLVGIRRRSRSGFLDVWIKTPKSNLKNPKITLVIAVSDFRFTKRLRINDILRGVKGV